MISLLFLCASNELKTSGIMIFSTLKWLTLSTCLNNELNGKALPKSKAYRLANKESISTLI